MGRLRNVGLQRGVQEGDGGIALEATEFDFSQHHHRRTISTQSSTLSASDDAELPTSPVLSGSSSTNWSIPSTPGSSGSFACLHPAKNESEPIGPVLRSENESLPVDIHLMSLSGSRKEGGGKVNGKDGVVVIGLDVDEEERKMDVDI